MKLRTLFLAILFWITQFISAEATEYAVALTATPVLNTADFISVFGGNSGRELKVDKCGQVRELEYIALPGTLFTIIQKLHFGVSDIYQVETDEYVVPPSTRLYVDSRFLKIERGEVAPRKHSLPPHDEITSLLRSTVGNSYIWGGNVLIGVQELKTWFYREIKKDDIPKLTLTGLDCSGLLYYATNGWTPRNSSQLIMYGQGVPIQGKRVDEIAAVLKPLDLIAWNGHVIIVLDRNNVIESRLECKKKGKGGVIITPLKQRLAEIMLTRRPANSWAEKNRFQNIFLVRRWYQEKRVEK